MKFISAEEFLKQDKKVQEVFIDWWKTSIGDLYAWNYSDESENDLHKLQACTSELVTELTNDNKGINEGDRIPLLTEGQLREFIEDKVESKISIIHEDNKFRIYTDSDLFGEYEKEYSGDYSILNALWNMAVETAKIVSREGEE